MTDEDLKETSYKVICASCGKKTLNVKEVYSNIPNFGRMVILSMLCSNCGYRLFDTISLEQKGPARVEFVVNSVEDLKAKIVRSTTSTLTVPELGLELKPGPRSEAFITNIEGVLDRFLGIAEQLMKSSEGKTKENAKRAVSKIRLAMGGKIPFKVIIDDEFGNSIIIPP
jgi:zinc finger protein